MNCPDGSNKSINFIIRYSKYNQLINHRYMKTIDKQSLIKLTLVGFVIIVFLTGCAGKETIEPCLKGQTYGFLGGLWHGLIAPIDFIGMLIGKNVTMYAQNNNGAWYAFGFLIGSGGWGFLGGKSLTRRRKRQDD
jgi:hypothetical protein